MKLIVGLGNPGRDYEKTRHNVGFMVVRRLAQQHTGTRAKEKFSSSVYEYVSGNESCLLMMPMTYMNRSGVAVRQAVDFYKLEPEHCLIVVDDTALDCGQIRLRAAGSAGGHNGLLDIESALGARDYPRLRIGIGQPQFMSQHDYVLGRFTAEQGELLESALDRVCECIDCWINTDIQLVMSRFNSRE